MRKLLWLLVASVLALIPSRTIANQSTTVMPTVNPHLGTGFTMTEFTTAWLNPALLSLLSNSSGTVAPANGPSNSPSPWQFWIDTSGSPIAWKIYDGAQWVLVGSINPDTHSISFIGQTQSVSPDAYGAKGDGATDDRLAFNAAAASFGGNGGIVAMTCTKKYYVSNIQLPRGVTLRGCYTSPDNPSGTNASELYDQVGALILSGATVNVASNTTYGSATVTVSSAAGLVPGMSIQGANIPGGAYIVSINGTNVTASAPATATSGATITACHLDTVNGSNFATMNGCTTANSGIAIGASVTSANIPGGTTVLGINAVNQVVLSANATVTATNTAATFVNPSNENYAFVNAITLGPMAGVTNSIIYRAGMTFPATDASAYSGTALRCGYLSDGCFAKDDLLIGFFEGFVSAGVSKYTYSNSRLFISHLQTDTVDGVDIEGSGDGTRMTNLHCWPYGTVQTNSVAGNYRTGYCFASRGQNDGLVVEDIFSYGHAVGIELDATSDVQIGTLSIDFNSNGGTIPGSIGFHTTKNTTFIQVDQVLCFGPERCIVRDGNQTEGVAINNVYCIVIGHSCVDISGGDLSIGMLNGYGIGQTAASPIINVTAANSSIYIGGGIVQNINGPNPIVSSSLLRADLTDINFRTDMADGTKFFGGAGVQPPIVSAANPLNLILGTDEEFLNSSATISTINGGSDARKVRLHFTLGAVLNDTGNIIVPTHTIAFPPNSWADIQWNNSYPKWVITAWGSESIVHPFQNLQPDFYAVADLPACDADHTGALATVTGGADNLSQGMTIAGGGSSVYLAWCHLTNWVVGGIPNASRVYVDPTTFATGLGGSSTCTRKGDIWAVDDGQAALAWGANIAGGGSTYYTINCNGSNWTVMGK